MIIGYFDYIVFTFLIALNVLFWRKKIKEKPGCFIGFFVFSVILPLISIKVEINRYTSVYKYTDSFELLYNYLKFPIYWIIGILQGITIVLRNKYASR